MNRYFQRGYAHYVNYGKVDDKIPTPKFKNSKDRIAWMSGWVQARTEARLRRKQNVVR